MMGVQQWNEAAMQKLAVLRADMATETIEIYLCEHMTKEKRDAIEGEGCRVEGRVRSRWSCEWVGDCG